MALIIVLVQQAYKEFKAVADNLMGKIGNDEVNVELPALSQEKSEMLNRLAHNKAALKQGKDEEMHLKEKALNKEDDDKDEDNEEEERKESANESSSKKNSFLNNLSLSQILSSDIDNLKQEISLQKPLPPSARKLLQEFIYKPNEPEKENENIVYYTSSEGKKSLSFISLSLIANCFNKPSAFDYSIPQLIKGLMEQKTSLLSTDVVFQLFEVLYEKTPCENLVNLMNYFVVNNYSNDIANSIAIRERVVKAYEAILSKTKTIPFYSKTVSTKDIIALFQHKNPLKIYYLLRKYAGLVPYNYAIPPELPHIPLNLPHSFSIFDWNMIEIARQMSLISQHLYHKIENSEFCNSNWMKGDKEKNAPNITLLINRFNLVSYWICEEILAYDRAQDRARVIERFITLANELRKMNNFNDCYNVINAFNSLPLKTLTKTWGRIKIEHITVLKKINELCSLGGNFANLRTEYERYKREDKTTGCVPYVGLFLKKLAFFDEGPKYFKDELVNLDKVLKIGDVFAEIKYFQQFTYNFQPVFALAFLADPKPLEENKLIELSNKLEPKFVLAKKKKKLKKRKTNTDSCFNGPFGRNFLLYLEDTSKQAAKTMSLKDKIQLLKAELKLKQMNIH